MADNTAWRCETHFRQHPFRTLTHKLAGPRISLGEGALAGADARSIYCPIGINGFGLPGLQELLHSAIARLHSQ